MRPVEKGNSSQVFTHWRDARDPLIAKIGNYCSYCERPLDIPDVEHKENKANPKYANKAFDWSNFLLACGYCNSVKGTEDTGARSVLFPDECNTAFAFEYLPLGPVHVAAGIVSPSDKQAAEDTRTWLLKLNRSKDTNGNRDLRWSGRLDAWREAEQSLRNLCDCDSTQMRDQVTRTAKGCGYFSVWMAVFDSDSDMKQRFIAVFTGTHLSCYNPDGSVKQTLIR